MLSFLQEFEGKPLVSVAKGDLDLGGLADTKEKEEQRQVVEQEQGPCRSGQSVVGRAR